MILGTAGHIDHGKTALVRALTGVDTDRLPEEKRRGITIELGFAPLEIDGAGTVGIVDVPGHEAFVRTMLAGATGVDVALVVVAADEGVMPQTREHVAILDLLGVRRGVVALTKSDLAEPEWMDLVEADVRDLLARTPLAGAPVVRCSARTGDGIAAVREALREAAAGVPARAADDWFRMPIDRAFSVKGTGTVVTGTIWAGTVAVDDAVVVMPGRHAGRVRGVESHGAKLERARTGVRTAIALGGVERADVAARGTFLVAERDPWVASTLLRADVALLAGAGAIGPRTRVRLHLGTADVGARLVAAAGRVEEGAPMPVRVALDADVVARAGDRFVLRTPSPARTIGGGVVTDPSPPRRRTRPFPAAGAGPARRLEWLLAETSRGVGVTTLPARLGVRPSEVDATVDASGAVRIGDRLFASRTVDEAAARCLAAVKAHHGAHPLSAGIPVQTLRSADPAAAEVVDAALAALARQGAVRVADGSVAVAGFKPGSSGADAARLDRVAEALKAAGRQPPSVAELTSQYGPDTAAVLKLLAARGDLVAVAADRYYAADVVAQLRIEVCRALEGGAPRTTSELREATGLTRKYIIPILEHFDTTGVTIRRGDARMLGPAGSR